MIEFAPYLITALIYLLVAADFWRGAKSHTDKSLRWHSGLIAIGLILHGGLLYDSLFSQGLNLSFSNALSAIFWLTVLIYWITDFKHHLHSLQAFVLPPAAFFVLLQRLLPETHVLPYADQPIFMTHLVIAMLAYSLFTFAAMHALLMAAAERYLHQKPAFIKLPDFPPLMTMETLLFRVISIGFILLTLTLISGIMFSELLFHQALKFNHKNVFTILSWLIFGGLLLGRLIYGWRGRTAIRWTLSGFVLLLLAYAGSKFVLEVLLHRL
ncbi:MAG TPA: cytochrome c biogenesis protein CcsA [Methylophilaceae bacterium]|nr:cytochrome c biogenesis protein CcsA [Methylophilaceae bacterium]